MGSEGAVTGTATAPHWGDPFTDPVVQPSGSAEESQRHTGVPVTIEHRPATPSPEDMTGLDLAYGFVQPSYQWVLARFEAGNTRLQTLQAIVASVSLAVPAFAKLLDESLSFTDWRFVAAVIVFLAAMAVGVVGRQTGTVRLVRPKELLDIDWLMLSEARFKYNALHWAAKHFDHTVAAVETKWRCAWTLLALFLVELALFFSWTLAA